MTTIFHEILNMSIVASWLIVAVILLRMFLKKAPRKIVCFLWALVAVRLICPFSVESRLSLIPSAQPIEIAERQYSDTPMDGVTADGTTGTHVTGGAEVTGSIDGNTYEAETANETGVIDIADATDGIVNIDSSETMDGNGDKAAHSGSQNIKMENEALSNSNPPSQGTFWDMVLSAVWLLGVILMLGYAVFSYAVLRRRTGVSMKMEGNIYLCDDIDTPFILGVFSPKVYLPSLLKEEGREYVIAHENAHLRRRDHWWKPLGYVILAVHWFNPLVWVAYVLLCRDIEIACDEKVISGADAEYKKSYAKTLLECSARGRFVTACPLAFGEVSVKERILTVLNYRRPAFWVVVVSVIACIVVGICFLTNPVVGEAEGEPSTQENVTEPESDEGGTDDITESTSVQESEGTEEIGSTQEMDDAKQETDSSSQSQAIIHDGWRITADEHSEYRYIYAAEQLRMRNMDTGEWYELTAFDLSYNYYDYDELKEGDIALWNITLADAVFEEYTEGDVGVSIYRYEERLPVESDAKPGEGYLVIYGASDSDTVWYTFMPLGMSREEVDAFLTDIHVERLEEPIRYYNPESELSCMEQFELAEDKISFLYSTVSTEDNKHIIYEGDLKNVFDCYVQEAAQKDPKLYESLKDPAGSAAALFDLEYESAEVYHCGNVDSTLVMLKLSDGQKVAFDMEKRGEVWQPVCQREADSEYCINVKLENEYINDVSAERLNKVSNEVEFIDREWMELGNDYVVLDTVENRDIVLYGLYGGAAMILRDGEKILPIWTSWTSPQMELPRIYCGDYDNDGTEEYALWTHMSTGTGVSGDELYIIETDWEKGADGNTEYSIREYRHWDWISELNVIGNRFDEASGVLTITLNDADVAELDISKLLEQYDSSFSSIGFGAFNSFYEDQGQWYFSASSGIGVVGSYMQKWECSVTVIAQVIYDEANGFHLGDIQISTESEYE